MKTAEEVLKKHYLLMTSDDENNWEDFDSDTRSKTCMLAAMEEYATEAIKADRERIVKGAKVRIKNSSKLSQYQFESRLFDKDNYEINPESILNLPIELKCK